jgi:hypothetical protein
MLRRHSFSWSALIVIAALLSACQKPLPPPPTYPDIGFSDETPIPLGVAAVEVDDEYLPPLKPPHVDHEFPVRIAAVAARWAHERLRAVGSELTARVIIRDASAIATELPKTPGVKGMFTNDQTVRYDLRVEMIVEIRDAHGLPLASVSATAERSRSVTDDITLNDRDRIFYEMTKGLMRDEDAALDQHIHQYLQIYIQ